MIETKRKRCWYVTDGKKNFFFSASNIAGAVARAADYILTEKWTACELWETTNKPILRRELFATVSKKTKHKEVAA